MLTHCQCLMCVELNCHVNSAPLSCMSHEMWSVHCHNSSQVSSSLSSSSWCLFLWCTDTMLTSSITEHIAASCNRFQVLTACFRTTLIPNLFLFHCSTHYFVSVFTLIHSDLSVYFITQTAVCRNPHNLSNRDSRTTKQFGYKRTFCQNVVSTPPKKTSPYIFIKNMTCLVLVH